MEGKLLEIRDNENAKQFETRVNGHLAKIEYMEGGNRIFLTHTEVAPQLEGQGVAALLVERVLSIIDERGQKIVPLCPYVATYIRKHPEWKKLLAHGINV
ncbi:MULTISPECIES: GNAT family N-acetyltransferase [Chitinophaga]|jgi:predicted GNAT family acetyltransferase|uniref:GNAT family N-acetyltransferase n=1 Tax=Chitinophaga caseinilytica TaxID=2267521 RepID=A0ABZ2YYR1_9BACT|nr:GNAT family N-acetyltransferase [Chitinophaga rhizosphaerae]